MPSFDIVSKIDIQSLDNTVNNVKKEISTRYDFKGVHALVELNKKDFTLQIETEDDMKLRQIVDLLLSKAVKQGIHAKAFDINKESFQSGKFLRKDIAVTNGIKQEVAKDINKKIKASGLKVQSQIMDDMIRVTGKKIDDLQAIIQMCESAEFSLPLQYINMRN